MAHWRQAQLASVRIFARLSPFQKEQIIQAVRRSEKSYSFMCGDGGNDVGALKEATVGGVRGRPAGGGKPNRPTWAWPS